MLNRKKTMVVVFIWLLFLANNHLGNAADKVVVIPLNKSVTTDIRSGPQN